MAACLDKVKALFPDSDPKDVEAVYDKMNELQKEGFLAGSGNPNADFMQKAKAMLDGYRRGVQIAEIKTLNNIVKSKANIEFRDNPVFDSKAEGVQAGISGTQKNIPGARDSAANRITAINNRLNEGLYTALKNIPGALKAYVSGSLDKEIIEEQYELANGRKGGVTNNDMALEIAKARQANQSAQLLAKNDAGAFVNDLQGRLMQRVYDREKLLAAGEEKFVQFMKDRVDSDKSFQKDFYTQDADTVLRDIYQRVTQGKDTELNLDGDDSRKTLNRIDAPANLARAMERGRTIHLDSAQSEYEFMKEFGSGTLAEDSMRSNLQTARRAALISKYGTNPELAMRELTRGMTDGEKSMIQRHWANVDGSASAPGVNPTAKYMMALRQSADMSKLGTTVFAHIPNLGSAAGMIQASGENFFSAIGRSLESRLGTLTSSARDEALHIGAVGADSRMGQIYSQFGTTEGGSWGWLNKAHNTFMNLSGIKWMSDWHEAGNTDMLASQIGYNSDKAFSELNPQYANILQKYGIGPVEWDVMRAAKPDPVDGKALTGIHDVLNLDKDSVGQVMRSGGMDTNGIDRVGKFQRGIADKMANYFNDRSNMATGKPGAFEKAAILNRGQSEDTAEGQLARFFSQFKGYGSAMYNQGMKGYYYDALQGKSLGTQVATAAPLMVTMAGLGYVSYSLKQMAMGRSAPTPYNENGEFDPTMAAKIATESMIRGGVGGIYADYLLGDFDSRHGRSAISSLAGPVVGQVSDMADMLTQARNAAESGDASKMRASALTRFITNNTIGNMPVLRQGLDYLFLNEMAETLNPGYTDRMKARLAKGGQTTWAPWAPGGGQQ